MWRTRRIFYYIVNELFPSFILGIVVFICILLMFQALRLTEFVLVHGVKLSTLSDMILYMSISFLPILLPMSLLLAILMTYNRLSQESELIAMKAVGISGRYLLAPAIIISVIVGLFSAQTAYDYAPWGNRQFEVMIAQLGNTKAAASIKEGTFSEGFFDMVVYANKVDSKTGKIQDLFIYNEQNPSSPVTVIAPEGELVPNPDYPGHSILLRLNNGEIHRRSDSHTVIKFSSYDITLNDPIKLETRQKSPASLTFNELKELKEDPTKSPQDRVKFELEYHKRPALSFACVVFALVGVAFGIQTNRRSGKSSGFVQAVGFIILYWVFYLAFESAGRKGTIPPVIACWLTNVIFTIFSAYTLRKKLA